MLPYLARWQGAGEMANASQPSRPAPHPYLTSETVSLLACLFLADRWADLQRRRMSIGLAVAICQTGRAAMVDRASDLTAFTASSTGAPYIPALSFLDTVRCTAISTSCYIAASYRNMPQAAPERHGSSSRPGLTLIKRQLAAFFLPPLFGCCWLLLWDPARYE